eukprot:CAMPEP_0118960210 /NCGR_PEP_ID=MMETSP1169-20130426/63522_1 /TAXON_ID=36882 /ORGANISM="Pyramimonas obovata, Strain CCMP722" /LENGTH=880 /DNA_ID=CAMNT_0006908359 /DNA_START=158 /DNA_END=2796 /DNA_ORIENTATION=+
MTDRGSGKADPVPTVQATPPMMGQPTSSGQDDSDPTLENRSDRHTAAIALLSRQCGVHTSTVYKTAGICSAIAFVFLNVMYVLVSSYPNHPKLAETLEDLTRFKIVNYTVGVCFAFGFFNAVMLFFLESHNGKRLQLVLVAYISLLCVVTHVLDHYDVTPAFYSFTGTIANPARYLMYVFTTCAMVVMMKVTDEFKVDRDLLIAVCANIGTFVFGFTWMMFGYKSLLGVACLIGSCGCFAHTLRFGITHFQSARMCAPIRSRIFLGFTMYQFVITWHGFPVMEILYQLNVLSIGQLEVGALGFHFFAKIIFANVLLQDYCLSASEKQTMQLEEAHGRQQKELIARQSELMKQKTDFVSAVTHELRTPLNAIIGLSSGLLGGCTGPLGEQQEELVTLINTSGLRLLNIVNDLLDAAKIGATGAKLVVKMQPVNLVEVLEVSVQLISVSLNPNVTIHTYIDPDLPAAEGDEGRISQIMANLLGNSAKFTKKGYIEVSAKEIPDGMLEIAVTDTGCGIPEASVGQIFEPFAQASDSLTREYGGTGLGLSMVKTLLEALHGTISCTSTVGKGTTFKFTLKRSQNDAPDGKGRSSDCSAGNESGHKSEHKSLDMRVTGSADFKTRISSDRFSWSTENSGGADLLPRKPALARKSHKLETGVPLILSVDDDATNHMVLESFLKNATQTNYILKKAMSGKEALELLSNEPYVPDVILLDVMMPGMSGFEVCKKIRETDKTVPIIFVSATSTEQDVVQGLTLGSNDFVRKPLSQGELLARVNRHLNNRETIEEESEEANSHRMLSELLPQNLVEQIQSGSVEEFAAEQHQNCCMLVSDISGMSRMAELISTADQVRFINTMCTKFDAIVSRTEGVFPISTFCSKYMVV